MIPLKYIHNDVGYNLDLQIFKGALGLAQLEQISRFIDRKKNIHEQYILASKTIDGCEISKVPDYAENNHWINLLQIDINSYGEGWEPIMHRLRNSGIESRPVWALNHHQKPYRDCQNYKIEKATDLVKKVYALPSSVKLSNEDVLRVVSKLYKYSLDK